jgi:hypothetical protein
MQADLFCGVFLRQLPKNFIEIRPARGSVSQCLKWKLQRLGREKHIKIVVFHAILPSKLRCTFEIGNYISSPFVRKSFHTNAQKKSIEVVLTETRGCQKCANFN